MADTVDHNEDHDRQHLGHDIAAGHETSDVSVRAILGFLTALVVSLILTVVFIAWLFGFYRERSNQQQPPAGPMAEQRKQLAPPNPRLQVSPALDMQEMRKQQDAALRETAWVDRETKHVRIPIDSAIEIVTRNGLPDWPATTEQKESTTKDTEDTKGERDAPDQ